MDQSMTTMEYIAFRRLQAEEIILNDKAASHEKAALGRLVKKDLAKAIDGGWKKKDHLNGATDND